MDHPTHEPNDAPPSPSSLEEGAALAFAQAAARIAGEVRTEDVVILDLRGLSNLADFFVLGTSTSDRQARAVLDKIEEFARTHGRRPFTSPDRTNTNWLLADYVDVIVHLFDAEHRAYYDLDGLWGDAPRVPLAES
ncbi:MAG: ribosome silencing factor [Phycisphaerales bacterium]|nr:ribosome silencing factor [Phycisphaerales bacterium]